MMTRKEIENFFNFQNMSRRDSIIFEGDLGEILNDNGGDENAIDDKQFKQAIITLTNYGWYRRQSDTLAQRTERKPSSVDFSRSELLTPCNASSTYVEQLRFYTVTQAAQILQCHPQTIYTYIWRTRPKEFRNKPIRLTDEDLLKIAAAIFGVSKNRRRGRPPTAHAKYVPFPSNQREEELEPIKTN